MFGRLILGSVALAVSGAAAAMPGIDAATLANDTRILSSDAFEGRRPGTPGGDKAVAYIQQRFAAIGLQPGNRGKWLQDVPLVTITTDPRLTFDINGGTAPLSLAYGSEVVVWSKRQVAEQALNAAPLVFVGYGINAPERGWNDYAGVDVRGKTVLILVNDPDWAAAKSGPDAGPFDGRTMTYYGRYTYKYEEAFRQGAAAALVIHDAEPAGYPWNVITTSWVGPQIDIDTAAKGNDRLGIEGWITRAAATKLLAAAGQDYAALATAAATRGFKALPLPLNASTLLHNSITRTVSANVVGVLPGSQRANEVVLYTAHWDHLGRCTPDARGDSICNGAVDNASGVAGLLAVASAQVKAGPAARSQLFIAVTGEESGLLGSGFYAANPVYPLRDTVGGVNMDGLNLIGPTRDFVITGAGKSELEPLFIKLAAAQHRTQTPEAHPEKGYYFRSDHFSLAKFGVPMLSAGSGTDVIGKPKGFGAAAAADYVAKRYHQPSDEFNPDWDWRGAVADLTLYAQLGRQLASSDMWPNWVASSEFRAVRDKSRGVK